MDAMVDERSRRRGIDLGLWIQCSVGHDGETVRLGDEVVRLVMLLDADGAWSELVEVEPHEWRPLAHPCALHDEHEGSGS
jgi:hypothetical protein